MSSKSKGGRSPIPSSLWEVPTVTEEFIKNLVVGVFLALREISSYHVPLART
jgi:hypothetical protein